MGRKLTPKIILIIVLAALAIWTLFPPQKKLKPGIDLAGGTSLIYEIGTQDLEQAEERGLAQRMIYVLRRRIDPANIQNLVWRPQGNTRFEIQMPLASAETQQKREASEKAKRELLAKNTNPATILRSLQKPAEERTADFNDFGQDDPNRVAILDTLGKAYDDRKALQSRRDQLDAELKATEEKISSAELDLQLIKLNRSDWAKQGEQQLQDSLKEFLESEDNLGLLTEYVKTYAEWAEVLAQLTDPETGKNIAYEQARRDLDKLNLSEEQIDFVLEMSPKSGERRQRIEQLKKGFPDRAELIDKVTAAFDEYRPFRGRLDDPRDLQRMLKGAGILEFRILPTQGHPVVDMGNMTRYVESLKEKGPKYASDSRFVWCEIEELREWIAVDEQGLPRVIVTDKQKRPCIVGAFGDKYYVLASNGANETMLHGGDKNWKLVKAQPGTEPRTGRRAIDFALDEKGGSLFGNVTGKNIDRPLCILLDGLAISAPVINTRITTNGQITGSFTQTDVLDMVNKLNAGSLPARLIEQPISTKTIGPSIGADNRNKGIEAGFIGLFVVMFCMLVYYMLAGSIADVALLMNILFVLAIMAGVRATFTLPGIAGIILTIGMSVDANVLIFERIREEQEKGSGLASAIKNGYQRAFRAILDANLTTFITAAILYWVASEEIKGFAIVLMLGIASSMFTALFVTRVIFDFLLAKRIIKEHLFMLRLIHKPNVNWMASRAVFFGISILLIAAGIVVFLTRDDEKNNKYDIEFTGGTSAQVNLKEPRTRQYVEDKIHELGTKMNNPALAATNVYSIGKSGTRYEINTTETNKTAVTLTFPEDDPNTIKSVTAAIGRKLRNFSVTRHSSTPTFVITTSQLNKSLVKDVLTTAFIRAEVLEPEVDEVVNNAILTAFGDELEIQQNLQPKIISTNEVAEEVIDSYPELADFLGGIKIECEIARAATLQEIDRRLNDLRFKPDMRDLTWYPYKLLGPNLTTVEPNDSVSSFVYMSVMPEAGLREVAEDEWTGFVQNETTRVLSATSLATSLPRVTQIDPSVGKEQKQLALAAIILSLFAIITYIWIRFGNVRYGLAAIIALVHDVCITLGAVTACTYIAATPIGEKLLIGDFKINLAMIAAFLTLIGYSLNDTIVVFDRIRENRRKARLTPQIINDSINQTISRTILTSFTTFIVVLIMYIFGGQGLRGFTFAIGFGVIVGTYSSIAIAAPILLLGSKAIKEKRK